MEFAPCDWSDDGKHVAVECPKITGLLYHNYKEFFSEVLYAACNPNYKLIFIDVGQYGCTSDSAVLRNSELGRRFESFSLNIPSEDLADENNFKDGEPFILLYYMVRADIFQLKD